MRREREEQYMVRIERCINDQINSDYGQRSTIQLDGKLTQKQKDSLSSYYMALRTGNTITKSRRKAKSYATFYEYMRHLRRFGLYLKKEDYSEANLSDAEGFIELHSSHSQTVSNSITKTLKCFYAWLGNRKKLDFSEIVDTLGNMKFNKSQIERLDQNKLLNDSDILKLLNAADTVRDKAIISVLSESGCRVGELIDLNLENVSFDNYGAFIDIQESKTKERKIRLIISEPYLKHYINQHGFKHKFESPLFYSMGPRNKGQRITMAGIRGILLKYAKRAEVTKRVNPHAFRHAALDKLGRLGWTERDLSVRAGWTDGSQMAKIYLHYSEDHVNNKYAEMYGIIDSEAQKEEVMQLIVCPKCNVKNPIDAKYCDCGTILNDRELFKVEELNKEINSFCSDVQKTPVVSGASGNSFDLNFETVMNNPALKGKFIELYSEFRKMVKQ
jgi:integrase